MYSMYAADPRARINLGIRRRLAPLLENDRDAHQADEQPAAVDAGHAGAVLRRRDRHGRQHLPRRPRRRAHADAVDVRPQRRLLARRPAAAVPAADPGPDLRLRGGQRRGAGARAVVAAELDAPPARGAQHARTPSAAAASRCCTRATARCWPTCASTTTTSILCVANVSRIAQPVELELGAYKGRVPVEMIGRNAFPPIGDLPYMLTLPAHGFFWFRLATDVEPPRWHTDAPAAEDLPVLVLFDGWNSFFRDRVVPWRIGMAEKTREQLEARAAAALHAAPALVRRQVRAAAAGQPGRRTRCSRTAAMQWLLALVDAHGPARSARYFVPLALAFEDQRRGAQPRARAALAVSQGAPAGGDGPARRRDGRRAFCRALVARSARAQTLHGAAAARCASRRRHGLRRARRRRAAPRRRRCSRLTTSSNSVSLLGDQLFLKAYRRAAQRHQPRDSRWAAS